MGSRTEIMVEFVTLIGDLQQEGFTRKEAIELLNPVEEKVHVEQHINPELNEPNSRTDYLEQFKLDIDDTIAKYPATTTEEEIRALYLIERRVHTEQDLKFIRSVNRRSGIVQD